MADPFLPGTRVMWSRTTTKALGRGVVVARLFSREVYRVRRDDGSQTEVNAKFMAAAPPKRK